MFSTCIFHIYKPVLILHFFPLHMLVSESSEESKSAASLKSVKEFFIAMLNKQHIIC